MDKKLPVSSARWMNYTILTVFVYLVVVFLCLLSLYCLFRLLSIRSSVPCHRCFFCITRSDFDEEEVISRYRPTHQRIKLDFLAKLEQGQGRSIRQNIRIDVNRYCRDVRQVLVPSQWIHKFRSRLRDLLPWERRTPVQKAFATDIGIGQIQWRIGVIARGLWFSISSLSKSSIFSDIDAQTTANRWTFHRRWNLWLRR